MNIFGAIRKSGYDKFIITQHLMCLTYHIQVNIFTKKILFKKTSWNRWLPNFKWNMKKKKLLFNAQKLVCICSPNKLRKILPVSECLKENSSESV